MKKLHLQKIGVGSKTIIVFKLGRPTLVAEQKLLSATDTVSRMNTGVVKERFAAPRLTSTIACNGS